MGNYLEILAVAALGSLIGSFLNVIIYRLPKSESFVKPSSYCPGCEKKLVWWHKIPIFSYFILGGRCRHCQMPISRTYPFVEGLTAISFSFVFILFGLSIQFFVYSIFVSLLITIAVIDLRHHVIFDLMTIGGIVFGIITAVLNLQAISPIDSLIGLVSGILILYSIRFLGNLFLKKESMGKGDIKLAGLIGVFLGWQFVLLSLFMSSIMITLVHIYQLISSKSKVTKQYPLGFYFSLGAIICLFFGNEIINAYIQNIL